MITTAFSGSLFVVAAPSGAGKSTLVNALLAQEPGIQLSISTTTRQPRPGEQDGREYHFTSAEDFVARADRGEFMEWAEVHGNYYGTSRLTVLNWRRGLHTPLERMGGAFQFGKLKSAHAFSTMMNNRDIDVAETKEYP